MFGLLTALALLQRCIQAEQAVIIWDFDNTLSPQEARKPIAQWGSDHAEQMRSTLKRFKDRGFHQYVVTVGVSWDLKPLKMVLDDLRNHRSKPLEPYENYPDLLKIEMKNQEVLNDNDENITVGDDFAANFIVTFP